MLLDPNVLNGLAQIMSNSNPILLKSDDLTKILSVIHGDHSKLGGHATSFKVFS